MAFARLAVVAAAAGLVAAAFSPIASAQSTDPLAGLTGPLPAATGNWMVRLRAVNLNAANKSDAIPALGVPDDAIRINNKAFPELDISYFFTPNIASELILTYPQQQDVTVGGAKIGSFRHLPPILTLQYHFTPESRASPA
jgi:outer membrane protein